MRDQIITTLQGYQQLMKEIQFLQMPPAEKKKYLRLLGREVAKNTRQRARSQTDLDGQPWKKRKSGNKRMMRRITRAKHMKVFADSEAVEITWPNNLIGIVARKQQEGIDEVMTARRMQQIYKGKPTDPCSRRQAKALQRAGFKLRIAGGGLKRVSQKWIMEHFSVAQAGAVLRNMLNELETVKQWKIPLAARSFLGADTEEQQRLAVLVLENIKTAIKRA